MSKEVLHSLEIDGRLFQVRPARVTGLQVRTLAFIAGDMDLVLEGQGAEPDRIVSTGDVIDLESVPARFYSRPPTQMGSGR